MAIPATSGTFKTNFLNMQIGDFIAYKYTAGTSGSIGVFSNLGDSLATAQANEIPVTGTATPSGYFYLIKVDKGLLLADRVIQHSIAWTTLNNNKYIEGSVLQTLVPIMANNTTPYGTVIRNDAYGTAYEAWRAFCNDGTAFSWTTKTKPSWIGYTFVSPKIIRKYIIMGDGIAARSPSVWTFEGSNDGFATYDVLDTQSNQISWGSGEKRTFNINNIKPYTSYRLNISNNNGDTNGFTAVAEIQMLECDALIRSMSGGCAYADANGNSSTTDLSYGGFPIINEYSKYIINSTLNGKIAKGDDNVWHWSNLYSLCKDTPITTIGTNGNRVYVGKDSLTKWGNVAATTVAATTGFRPVFEYVEQYLNNTTLFY